MLGNLPPGYNKAVHGPYDPAVFYGKQDIPLSQVKVYQLPAWLARRQFYNPIAYGRALSRYGKSDAREYFSISHLRAYWRWNHKHCLPKYCGVTPFVQMSVGFSALFYLMNYGSISEHKNQKYHW